MADSKVMLVTGGSGSVGTAVAHEALRAGWRVVVQGRDAARLAALVEALGGSATAAAITGEVGAEDDAASIVAGAFAKFGRLDAVVDCVSTGPRHGRMIGVFKDTTPEVYAAFYDLSAAWFQRLAHAAYPHLAGRGGTLIAFISDAGKFAAANQTIIGAARAAIIGFVRNLSVEAARDGIRAHCIAPSYVVESRSAVAMGSERLAKAAKRAGLGLPSAAEIAPMTVFLCGEGAAKITGQVISINGGLNA
jgi:NAD(P)-dependent dehydrogenase (short-subunit alcohol dehydrogenase family)